MPDAISIAVQIQHLATLVSSEAAAKEWPGVTYQAAFVTVVRASAGKRWLEGKSCFWDSEWNADADRTDHPVSVASGAEPWHTFIEEALFPDLLRARAQLKRS